MALNKNNTTKNKTTKGIKVPSIMGIAQLFVVASIAYTTTIIVMGTEGYIPMVLAAPQALWASVVLVKRFVK